jgi:5,5'-dehydrodivanillate O-demethylase oxygenase subunit
MAVTTAENETLTRVGPGTPVGQLMRKYWHPVSTDQRLRDEPVHKVRLLGQDFVLFRDRRGGIGMVDPRCPHRLTSLEFGIPEESGLRCCYHGWLFDAGGHCLEMPLEPPDSQFKDRISLGAYPVEEMGGLIWAYIGEDTPPLLPRWNLFHRNDGFRHIIGHDLPCNWLQVAENRGDLGHAIYLHGRLFRYVLERQGRLSDDPNTIYNVVMKAQSERLARGAYTKYRPLDNEFGFTKGEMPSDGDPDSSKWQIGTNPILFPYLLAFGPARTHEIRRVYELGVPIDDTKTWHIEYLCYTFPEGVDVPSQDVVPYTEAPLYDERGKPILDYILAQDMVAWYGQGPLADRTQEHLAVSDRNVLAYRNLLKRELDKVALGEEPMNRFWDEKEALNPEFRIPGFDPDSQVETTELRRGEIQFRMFLHRESASGSLYLDDDVDRHFPNRELLLRLYADSERILNT